MNIKDYLMHYGIPVTKFAERIGVNRNSVHGYIRGRMYPRPEVARRIVEFTRSEITLDDIYYEEI